MAVYCLKSKISNLFTAEQRQPFSANAAKFHIKNLWYRFCKFKFFKI